MLEQKCLASISNKSLELIIFPTEQCNFRCTYCYEDFSIGKMKIETVEAIKNLISLRATELEMLKISWFGGEPLAAKDIVFDICNHVITWQKKNNNLRFQSVMTTNGYRLNEETLAKLIAHRVGDYQISLDGTEEMHNSTRKRMDGAGTFQKIWENLLSAKNSRHKFSIIIRLHIKPENIEDIYRLLDLIKKNFAGDPRFSVFFKAIENLGGSNAGSFETLRGEAKSVVMKKLYAYLGHDLKLVKVNDGESYICYAAMANSFAIRADGRIGKCTVALNDDRNILGEIRPNGRLNLDPEKLSLWTRGFKSKDLQSLSCPMSQMPQLNTRLNSIPIVVASLP